MMRLFNVSKRYGEILAINEATARIDQKDFIIVTGPSGSGKSTFLKILGGLVKADNGKVLWHGQNIFKYNEDELSEWRRKNLGYLFQEFELINYLNAIENVVIPPLYDGKDYQSSIKAAIKLLGSLGLKEHLYHYPNELSGGQRQRVAIARAIINKPSLILCDEPTGALDKSSSKIVMKILKRLNELGKTIILVTHDQALEDFGNRKWIIEKGRLYEK